MPKQIGPRKMSAPGGGTPGGTTTTVERVKPLAVTAGSGALEKGFDLVAEQKKIAEHPELFETHEVHIDQLVNSPFNPHHRAYNEDELQDILPSIIEVGVMSHLIVVERAVLLRNEPHLEPLVPDTGRWVVAAGHRRKGGARLAKRPIVPIAVRNDWATAKHLRRIVLHENSNRMDLLPSEEAEQYRGLRDEERMKVDEIADMVGVSKGQISKRLSLLKLPSAARDLVDRKRLSQDGALELMKLKSPSAQERAVAAAERAANATASESTPEPRIALKPFVQAELAAQDQELETSKARAELARLHIDEIDPAALWGAEAYQHRLRPEDVDLAQSRSGIAGAAVENGRPIYYAREIAPHLRSIEPTSGPEHEVDVQAPTDDVPTPVPQGKAAPSSVTKTSKPPVRSSEYEAAERARELARQAHEDAAAARRDACRRLIADLSSLRGSHRNDLLDLLADGVLTTANRDAPSVLVVRPDPTFLAELLGDAASAVNGNSTDRQVLQRAAVSVALAGAEARAAHPSSLVDDWPPTVRRYIQRLVDLGYHSPSEHETAKLA